MSEFGKDVLKQRPAHITRCEQQWTTTKKPLRSRHRETMMPSCAGTLARARSCKIGTSRRCKMKNPRMQGFMTKPDLESQMPSTVRRSVGCRLAPGAKDVML